MEIKNAPRVHIKRNLVDTLSDGENLKTLNRAVTFSGLARPLSSKGPFTFFAPTEAGFSKLSKEARDELFLPENKDRLFHILSHHIVWGIWKASDFEEREMRVATLNGGELSIRREGEKIKVMGVEVSLQDIVTSNGVIHLIDFFLEPPMFPKNIYRG